MKHPAVIRAFGLLCGILPFAGSAQLSPAFADSLRIAHHIPELAYAAVSADSVIELHVLGEKRAGSGRPAEINDHFRLGSNTKTITGFIAARLVHDKRISWDTRFFDLFPEMRKASLPVYRELTLLDLLSFRARLYKYTYTDNEPKREALTGAIADQQRQLAAWGFAHEPLATTDSVNFSNLCYVAAGLMLERATGRTYDELVSDLGRELGIDFGFGAPNTADTLQPWGHDAHGKPEPPGGSYKLGWLEAAGNIHVDVGGHARFLQLLLSGLSGRSDLLTREEFKFLLFGRPRCALGWFWFLDEEEKRVAWHVGNPGSFLSKVYVHADEDRAYILFANLQSDDADAGLDALYEGLRDQYAR